jgi:hypothetical protein
MISADIQDKAALIKAAWQRWFEADYSWEGLKARPVYGFTSIQDYWRVIPKTGRFRSDIELIASGELITVDGQKTYHLAHLPLLYEDGSTTIKTSDGEATHKRMMSMIYRHLHSTNDHANLDGIVVAGFFDASISEVKKPFRASFSDAFFCQETNFGKASFNGKTDFTSATFISDADFFGSNFYADADFSFAIFMAEVDLSAATFDADAIFHQTKFNSGVIFRNATFSSHAGFSSTTFENNACFQEAAFNSKVSFEGAKFIIGADFSYTTFNEDADFNSVSFCKQLSFTYGRFRGRASFRGLAFPEKPADHHQAFFNTSFHDLTDFSGAGFRAFAAFDGANLLNGLRLDKSGKSESNHQNKNFEQKARHTFNRELEAIYEHKNREVMLEQLEGGCRTLKLEMERQTDKNREQLLYKFELLARRAQTSTPPFEKWLSRQYERFADYGGDAFRPVLGIFTLFISFAAIIGLFSFEPAYIYPLNLTYLPERAIEAITVSGSRIFPFGAFDDVSKNFAKDLSPLGGLIFRLLGTLESFLALTLAFLFGLSVRRRFQIS